ncbi:MAG: TolC family protein [Acidobacteriaceae bacterium]
MISFSSFRMTNCTAWFGVMLLSGCATYHPVPLPTAPDLAKAPSLTLSAREFWLPGLKPHPFPKDGLDETAVITLAVFDNPDLKAARLQAGVASAQLLQAGLLPDPQVSTGFGNSALHYGYDVGLSEDIQALMTRGAARAAASAQQQQVHLDILWQEWQVAEKARELFIQARADHALQQVLTANRDLLANRYQQDELALRKGNVTLSTVAADLTVLTDADTSLRQVQLDANLTRHQLNQLLGLRPEVQLPLIDEGRSQPVSQAQFQAAVAALPHRRVDLLALAAGYQSQEQSVRQAVLAQFPALSAGVNKARDPVEGVNSVGLNVSLTLPLFNRNRGQIAVQRATRAVLRQTYQARLDQAAGDADQVWSSAVILRHQLQALDAALPVLQKSAAAAEQSFRQNNLDAGLYVSVKSTLFAKQAEAIRLRAALDNAQSALRTLLGLPFGNP